MNTKILFLLVLFQSTFSLGVIRTNQAINSKPINVKSVDEVNSKQLNNIAFELPDLTRILTTEFGEFQIEAFKSVLNDQILKDNDKSKQSQLFWVSIGNIKLLSKNKNGTNTIFHSQDEGYSVYLQTLTEYQREILAETAKLKYNISLSKSQIVNLILSKFSCTMNLFNNEGEKRIIKGEVHNFHNYPLRMDFWMPLKSKERIWFEKRLQTMHENENVDLRLLCSIASSGQQIKTNTLTINAQLTEQLEIVEKLFGYSNANNKVSDEAVYVTRDQLASLAAEIYSTLRIIEDYEIPETQFNEEFIQELLKQVSMGTFQSVSFDKALEKLSKYTYDFSSDLKPDEIKRDVGSILKVQKTNNKTHIVVNEEFLKKLQESGKIDGKFDGSFSFAKLFKVGSSVGYSRDHKRDWEESGKSLNDQLKELNSETTDDVKWEIDGNRIIPKSLNVARMMRGNFRKTLVFQRVRRQYTDAPFHRSFAIYTRQAANGNDKYEEVMSMLNQQKEVVDSLKNEQSTFKSTTVGDITSLRTLTNDISTKLATTTTKLNSAEAVINEKGNTLSQLQTSLNNLNTHVTQFTHSSHCLLANGNCPPGYPHRFNAYMKAVKIYNGKEFFQNPLTYIKAQGFGNSYIRCHGNCGQYADNIGEIELVTCCK